MHSIPIINHNEIRITVHAFYYYDLFVGGVGMVNIGYVAIRQDFPQLLEKVYIREKAIAAKRVCEKNLPQALKPQPEAQILTSES